MIETILSGLPTAVVAIAITLGFVGVIIGCEIGVMRLWACNRILGGIALVTCIVIAVLALSYVIGLTPA